MKRFLFSIFFFFASFLLIAQENQQLSQLQFQQDRWFNLFFDQALKFRLIGDYDKAVEYYTKCLQLNDKSSSILFEMSRIFNYKKDYLNADKFIDLAIKYDSTDNIHYIRYATDLKIGLSKYEDALSLYDKILKSDSEYYNYLICSRLCCELKQFDRAFSYLDKVNSDDIFVRDLIFIERSEIYLKQGKNKKCLQILKNLYNQNSSNSKYSILLYNYYQSIKDSENAIKYCKIASELPDGESMLFDLAEIYFSKNDINSFFATLNKAFSNINITPELKYSKILSYLSNASLNTADNFSNFKSLLRRFLLQHPDFEPVYILSAKFYITNKHFEEAIAIEKSYIDVSDGSLDFWHDFIINLSAFSSKEDYRFYLSKAYSLYNDDAIISLFYGELLQYFQEYDFSIKVLQSSLKSYYSNTSAYNEKLKISILNTMASDYFYLNNLDSCYHLFDEVLSIDNYNVLALNNYSYFLSLESKNLDKAESMIRKVIDIEPLNPTYLDTYAWVLYKLNRFSESLFIIERAIDNGGQGMEIFDHYGDILFANNILDKAKSAWSKALEYDNNNKSILDKLNNLIQ